MSAISLLNSLPGLPVLCVGDIMLDVFIYGEATRLSPEAPVPVVRLKKKTSMPGGVGNVVRNLGELGALPLAVSVVGYDDNARLLMEQFTHAGWLPPIMIRDSGHPTIVKTRVIAGIQQIVRLDEESPAALEPAVAGQLIEVVRRHISGVRAVIISDYGKGIVSPEIASAVIALAQDKGIPVVVDPKGSDYSKYSGAALVTPNRSELAAAVGREVSGRDRLAEAGREIMSRHQIQNILVTLSEEGMLLIKGDQPDRPIALPALVRQVFDVSGAGDTVVSVMAAALAAGATLETGAELAALAAGVVVGKVGTAVACPAEIETAARELGYLLGHGSVSPV